MLPSYLVTCCWLGYLLCCVNQPDSFQPDWANLLLSPCGQTFSFNIGNNV